MCTSQVLDPLGVFTKPSIQAPKLTPPPQSAKAPDAAPLKKRNSDQGGPAVSDSTMLTGTEGVPTSSLNLGGTSLLGG
jgi:hypothetical protein